MADETTTPAATPEVPAAPTPAPAQDPETQHAVESLERKRSALGAPKSEAAPEAAKPAAPPEEPAKPSAEEARRRYQERAQRRAEEQEQARRHYAAVESENQRLLAERQEWMRTIQEQFGPQEDSGLPAFEEDPKAWYQAAFDRALDERLGPLLERFESYDVERATVEQQRQQATQAQAAFGQLVSFVGQAEEEYAATAEGSGYKERFDRYVRGHAAELQAAGASADQIASRIFTEVLGMFRIAAESGEHPAYFIDSLIRHHPLAQEGKGGAAPPVNGNGAPSLAPGRRGPVEELQKTAAAPGVSGSLSRGGAAEPTGAADVKALVRRGQVKTDDLRALVNAKAGTGISVRARVREAMRQIESLADAQAK